LISIVRHRTLPGKAVNFIWLHETARHAIHCSEIVDRTICRKKLCSYILLHRNQPTSLSFNYLVETQSLAYNSKPKCFVGSCFDLRQTKTGYQMKLLWWV